MNLNSTKRSEHSEKKELRLFAFMMAGMLILIFGLILPWVYNWEFSWTVYYIAGLFFLSGLLLPVLLRPVYFVWLKFSHILGLINSKLLLFIIYFMLIVPFGLVAKLFGFDPMNKKNTNKSYYISRKTNNNNMENPF